MSTSSDCACCPPAPPSAPSESANPPGLTAINYRLDTQSGFKRSMLQSIADYPALLPLTTRADEDPAIAMADAWACALDVLTFYQERIANEGFLRTATQRRSILELARAIGYELRPGVAASTELAFTMETAPGAPDSALVPTGTKVQSIPTQGQKAQTFETLSDITARARWSALLVQSTRATLPPRLGQTTLFLLGQNTRLQIGDPLLIVGDEWLSNDTSEHWDFRRVAGVRTVLPAAGAPGGTAGYTVVHLDRGLGSVSDDVWPARKNARVFALRTRANLFGYNAPDWRTMPLNVRAEYLGVDASKMDPSNTAADAPALRAEVSAYPEWPGFTVAATSGPPAGVAAGTGLRGSYYAGVNFEDLVVEQVDPTVHFDMASGTWPPNGVPHTNFSVRWEGWIEAPTTGQYVFTTTTDDGARLWVDGDLVINAWKDEAATANSSAPISLVAYRKYALRLEFYQHLGAASADLSWQITDEGNNVSTQDPIPQSQLYPSDILSLYLDAVYPKITPRSWVVLSHTGSTDLYQVTAAGETTLANFAQSGKATWLALKGDGLYAQFNEHLRDTAVFGGSDELDWTTAPNGRLLSGNLLSLTTLEPDLQPGQRLAISGLVPATTADSATVQRLQTGTALDVLIISADGSSATVHFTAADDDATDTDDITLPLSTAAEMVTIQGTTVVSGTTQIALREQLQNLYVPQTVRINANIAPASHGDSRQMRVTPEILGSGDGSAVFQSFQLKQSPVTYVSASTPSGATSSLTVKVDDVTWGEVPSLYGVDSRARVHTSRIADDATLTVRFGDGITGARLPSGLANVQAVYRVGLGTAGNLDAGQLTLLLSPQLGLKSVVNPTDASGGVDPEKLADARRNAPTTVLTLDRIVSLGDFEAYASSYPGIGKAQAVWVWNGAEQVVVVTVAGTDGEDVQTSLLTNLQSSMDLLRPPHQALVVIAGTVRKLQVTAQIKVDAGYDFIPVQTAVVSALLQAFGFANRQFGQPISASELVSTMQQVTGVSYVVLNSFGSGAETSDLTGDPIGASGARWDGTQVIPAEMLQLDPNGIQLTEVGI